MESKKINQLATELAPDLSDITIIGDPTTGISKKITLSQMASLFTGTVEEYATLAAFPLVGVADTIYIALDTNVIYRYDTSLSAYVILSPNIINSLVFSDANGFDGTITLVGSVATLSITTALTLGSVPFIGASGALTQDNANLFFDDTNNRLGINTNAPTTALDVFGSGIIGRLNATSTNNSYLGFASNGTNKWSAGNVQSDHRFRIFSEANSAELITILQTGEFGIGISNPTTKFHIDGGATALIANLDANVSVAKSVSFRSDNSSRINLEVSGTESGSNAGADLFIRRYSDAGALIDTPLTITRSTGAISLATALSGTIATFTGDVTLAKITSAVGLEYQIRNTNGASGNHVFKSFNTTILTLDGATNYASFASNLAIGKTAGSTFIFDALKEDSTTNSIIGVVQIGRATTGTAANDIGGNIQLTAEDTAGNQRTAAYISWKLAVASSAAPEGFMSIGSRNASDALNILDSGRIGIGTASPLTNFSVAGANGVTDSFGQAYIYTTDAQAIDKGGQITLGGLFSTSRTAFASIAGRKTNGSSGDSQGYLSFGTNSGSAITERLRILNNGQIYNSNAPSADWGMRIFGSSVSGSSYGMEILGGTTSGDISFAVSPRNGSVYYLRVRGDGNVALNSSVFGNTTAGTIRTVYIGNSDYFLGGISSIRASKKNIENISDIDFIYKLNPVTFNYRKKDESQKYTEEIYDDLNYGLIAEDTAPIANFLINYNDKEDNTKEMVGIEYPRLIIPMLKAIQQQKAQIEELKALINK